MFKKVWSILLCLVLLTGTLLPVSALNVTPDYGNAHVSIEAEDLGGGEAVLAVYLNNCVGLTAVEVFIDIEGSSLRYFYWAGGLDDDEVDESKSNVFTAECNELPDGIVKCGGYFKECLWTAEDFAANAKKNKDCAVNTEKFHCMDIYMEYDDEIDLSVISATADLEFKGCESFANTYLGKGFIYGTAVPVTVRKAQVCKHDGATEIRNAKEPTYTAAGYTGDSYCLLCNEKIATGSVIPVLSNIYTPNPDADVEVEFEYDETTGEVKADLYLIDAVGVSSFELAIDCFTDGAKLQYVDFAVGEDAKQVGNSYSNSFACESAPEDDGQHILFGAYFRNCLWTSEHFFADSDYGKICDVNADRFHFATYYFEISPELANCIAFGCRISGYLKFKGDDSDDIEYAAMDDVVISKSVNLSVGGCCHLDTEIRNAKDPTYTEEGYTGDTYCVDCNKKLSTGSVIPVLEKTDSYMSLEVQDLGEGEVAIDVYLNNCIGLTSLELFIDIEGSGLTYAYDENGADADEVSKCKNNAYNSECNELEANTLFKYGSYFKDCLWTAEHFAADAKKGQQCTVNTEKFHCATIYMEYDGEIDLSALSATADVEFGGGDLDAELYPDIGFIYDTFVPVTIIEAPVCNHDGPTEIRNAKDPTRQEDGYAGDTYCLLCNEKIASGPMIPKIVDYYIVPVSDGAIDDGYLAVDVYLDNCVGLTSFDFDFTYPSEYFSFEYIERGADAKKIFTTSHPNAINMDYNEIEPGSVQIGAYFKEGLLSKQHFIDTSFMEPCVVNDTYFHFATIYFMCRKTDVQFSMEAITCFDFNGFTYEGVSYPAYGKYTSDPTPFSVQTYCAHTQSEIRNQLDPTCVNDGYTGDKCCTFCNATLAAGTTVVALGHAFDDGVIAVEPTYVAEGEKLFTCTRCPEQKTEPIEKLVAVFEDSENCKEDEDGTIVSVGERTVEQLLEQASPGAYITDKNGEQLDAEAKYGTGCVLVQPDGNTVTLVVAGDVSGDGCVEAEDARTALRAAVSLENLTEEYFKAADINGDGVISAEDARLALRSAVGLEDLSKWL